MEVLDAGSLPGFGNFPFAVALGLAFGSLLSLVLSGASTHFLRDAVALCNEPLGLFDRHRRPVHPTELVRLVLAQHGEYPIQQMRRARADRLLMVLAFLHHLIIVNRCNLRVPAPCDFGVQIRVLLDQIGASLAHLQPFRLSITTLSTLRDHATPAAEQAAGTEALGVSNETGIDRRTVLSHTFECFQIAAGMDLPIERTDRLLAQRLVLLFEGGEPCLFTADLGLQLSKVQILILAAVEGHHLCSQSNECLTPCSRTVCSFGTSLPLLADRGS